MASLQLNRAFQNANFESWKIGSDFVSSRITLDLPASIYEGASEAVDYLHTRASVLRNHLIASHGRLFVMTNADDNAAAVHAIVESGAGSAEGAGPQLTRLAVVPVPSADTTPGAAVEASLHCSLAVVAPTQHATEAAAAAGTADQSGQLLLVSTGHGDLVLVQEQHHAMDGHPSNVVYPLRSAPPSVGVRPFSVEAAWRIPSGHIRCVLAAISNTAASSSSSSRASSHAHSKWICDTWLVTLSATQQQQQPVLQVADCQLLLVSKSPPAAAIATAAAVAGSSSSSESLVIVSEPALEDDELPAGPWSSKVAANGTTSAVLGQTAEESSAAAAAAAVADDEDLGDMEIDPRTLQQAAARLAQFTTDTTLGDVPQQQWTDVFKESGPGDLGSGESDPAVDIMLYTSDTAQITTLDFGSAAAAAAVASSSAGSSSSTTQLGRMTLASTVSCGPHRLLAVQESLQDVNNNLGNNLHSCSNPGLLLGLTDDVDCAVVTATLQQQQQLPAAAAADPGGSSSSSAAVAARESTAATAVAGGGGGDRHSAMTVNHLASIPALAYVVAGKTQRRHLLLGGSGSPVSAVLVEGQKYVYLYGQMAQGGTHGKQQLRREGKLVV